MLHTEEIFRFYMRNTVDKRPRFAEIFCLRAYL